MKMRKCRGYARQAAHCVHYGSIKTTGWTPPPPPSPPPPPPPIILLLLSASVYFARALRSDSIISGECVKNLSENLTWRAPPLQQLLLLPLPSRPWKRLDESLINQFNSSHQSLKNPQEVNQVQRNEKTERMKCHVTLGSAHLAFSRSKRPPAYFEM